MTREYSQLYDKSPRAHVPRPSPKTRPPSFIIGVNNLVDDVEEDEEQEREDSKDIRHRSQQHLETIASSAASLPGAPSTPLFRRKDIPRGGGSIASASSEKKVSVAQRARLEADRTSTPVRARLDEKTKEIVEKKSPPKDNRSVSSSGLWRRMEEAVLGPRSDEDESIASSSIRSTRVTDYTEETQNGCQEEKKMEASPLSLQERSRLQRAKQLQFLREQGLIQDDSEGKGLDTVSVASSSHTSPSHKLNRT
jgi:hypothetical protein